MARKSIINGKDHAFSPRDIGKKADGHVRQGTRIRMLEYDLPRAPDRLFGFVPLIPWGNQWKNLFEGWLKQGAQVELYAQRLSSENLDMLNMLKAQYRKTFHKILFGSVPDTETFKKEEYANTHFTLFKTPRVAGRPAVQLWKEAEHKPGDKHMHKCSYFQPQGFGVSRKEEAWEADFRKYERALDYIVETLHPKRKSQKNGVTVMRG